jgi:hypothetical protein
MSVGNGVEQYYPMSLCKAFFNWCIANDVRPTFELLHDFVCEVQRSTAVGQYGPRFQSIKEVLNDIKSDDEDA